jgi:phosphopantothenoylcysteine decarboxylase / phosphopantothenate---cysteine ligase
MLRDRQVVIGVTGGIAAYKTCELVRLCVKAGADVQAVMTRNATEFVTPLTFEALSNRSVVTGMYDGNPSATEHITVPRWGEIIVVAPATANCLAKAASGIADDFLTTTFLSTRTPIVFVPAMNTAMWQAPVTQRNVQTLRELGHTVTATGSGGLACGEEGDGRMLEPREIFHELMKRLPKKGPLVGRRVLVTAGPTPEPIDPVRLLTNRSTGRMGVSLAEMAIGMGAEVTFVHGPLAVPLPAGADHVAVQTAAEMRDAVVEHFPACDTLIMAAAVADYRPRQVASQKVKKSDETFSLELERTEDIMRTVSESKDHRIVVGFAMESDVENAEQHARDKVVKKNLDFIALNMVGEPGAGFAEDTNRVTLLGSDGNREALDIMSKDDVARRILDRVAALLNTNGPVDD